MDVQNYLVTATVPFITMGFLFRSLYHFNLFSVSMSFSTIKYSQLNGFSARIQNLCKYYSLHELTMPALLFSDFLLIVTASGGKVEFGFVVFVRWGSEYHFITKLGQNPESDVMVIKSHKRCL